MTTQAERTNTLNEQINITIRNLERGEVQKTDRVFLNHVLEEFQLLVTSGSMSRGDHFGIAECAMEMVGSTAELVEDGLE